MNHIYLGRYSKSSRELYKQWFFYKKRRNIKSNELESEYGLQIELRRGNSLLNYRCIIGLIIWEFIRKLASIQKRCWDYYRTISNWCSLRPNKCNSIKLFKLGSLNYSWYIVNSFNSKWNSLISWSFESHRSLETSLH